ncbi:serine hydrolase domain-containing protein [Dellaglioa sp. P0083]|uniref:serine hydrolase domain-containing protein n=1 Tax=Dellaglioa kimchii TaxID=3344667 RepID=UPI0038D3A598
MLYPKTINKIRQLVNDGIVPGASYGVIHHNTISNQNYLGYSQLVPETEQLTDNALYDIASLTKVIGTTTLILKLQEEGRLNVDDSVKKYLPNYQDERVTLRHMLTHTADFQGYIKNRNQLSEPDLKQALFGLSNGENLGKKVIYSDIGLVFLGYIIESILKIPVQQALQQEVLNPLGLTDSTFSPNISRSVPTEIIPDLGLLKGIVHDPKARILKEHCGSAGLFSTVSDLLRFMQWFMSDGPERPVLRPETTKMLFSDQTPTRSLGRSLGWDLRGDGDCLSVYHTGFTGTFMIMDQSMQDGLVVLTNRVHPTSDNSLYLTKRDKIIESFLTEKAGL